MMNVSHTRFAATLILPLALSSCGVLRSVGLVSPRKVQDAEVALAPQAPLTTIGRTQLDQGNSGLAIATFRKALETGEKRAPVLNGLGVAYAKIGRNDLAAQYFRQATEAEPQNENYAANLALLLRSSMVERLSLAERNIPADAPQTRDPTTAFVAAAAQAHEPEAGKLVRLSSREFEIRIVTDDGATTNSRQKQSNGKALVRIDLSHVPKSSGPIGSEQ